MKGNAIRPMRSVGGGNGGGEIKTGKNLRDGHAAGGGVGPLTWYECNGNPTNAVDWVGHELVEKMAHGHSLQVADIDGDGNLDIFAAEMAKWTEKQSEPDHPDARAWIFYGDGHGHFRKTEFSRGIGFHEARVADLDGDGDMDIL